jgi:hypothetical protein
MNSFRQNSNCAYRCFGSNKFVSVKCQCLRKAGIFWLADPAGCHWDYDKDEYCQNEMQNSDLFVTLKSRVGIKEIESGNGIKGKIVKINVSDVV